MPEKKLGLSTLGSLDNTINQIATEGETEKDKNVIDTLWNDTFMSFPPEMIIKLPYYFTFNYTSVLGLTAPQQFRINSIFDFDLTGVGHQPLGRDTWTNIYNYYKVLKTKFKIQYIGTRYATDPVGGSSGGGGQVPMFTGYVLSSDLTAPSNQTNWQEAAAVSQNDQYLYSPIKDLNVIASRGMAETWFEGEWIPDMFDTAVLNSAGVNSWTAAGANPDNANYLTLLICNNNSTATEQVTIRVWATMLVAFKQVNSGLQNTTQ